MKPFDVYSLQPIAIERGEGSWVWDAEGRRYLDLYGGHAVISIGHGHPHWKERIRQQLDRISFYSNSVLMPLQEELAEKLGRISGRPGYQLFLCNSGAEANENALKMASFHNGRSEVVAFTKAFHGRTSLAVSATDNPSIIAPVNRTENVTFLPYNDEAALEAHFRERGDRISSVILEGIQGVGGIIEANDAFLQTARRLCDASGALLIADSVQCGYGRTGDFFSHDRSGISADFYTVAKGMGNGFPVGGVLIAPHIRPRHGLLGTTFGGAHLACAAALAVLEVIERDGLMDKAKASGDYLIGELKAIEGIQGVRGRGLMIGFEPPAKDLRQRLLQQHHIFTGEAKPSTVRLLPALNIDREAQDHFLTSLQEALLAVPQP